MSLREKMLIILSSVKKMKIMNTNAFSFSLWEMKYDHAESNFDVQSISLASLQPLPIFFKNTSHSIISCQEFNLNFVKFYLSIKLVSFVFIVYLGHCRICKTVSLSPIIKLRQELIDLSHFLLKLVRRTSTKGG